MTKLRHVLQVDWNQDNFSDADIQGSVSSLDYLNDIVNMLGQLSSQYIADLIKLKPSGFKQTTAEDGKVCIKYCINQALNIYYHSMLQNKTFVVPACC